LCQHYITAAQSIKSIRQCASYVIKFLVKENSKPAKRLAEQYGK